MRAAEWAGSFYPAAEERLRQELRRLVPEVSRRRALVAIAPHAGYQYSGAVAGAVYGRLEIPNRVVLLCFHHRGAGRDFAVWPPGEWETPLGRARVPPDLVERICAIGGEVDEGGHRQEHSGEVQLPFLQWARSGVEIAPVAVSAGWEEHDRIVEFGRRLGELPEEVLVVASTDLNHYEPHEITLEKDAYAIEAIRALDADALRRAVFEHRVTMCGFAPVLAAIAYARARGATEATLVEHRTSAHAGGDRARTVGYAGLMVPCGN